MKAFSVQILYNAAPCIASKISDFLKEHNDKTCNYQKPKDEESLLL